jgi:hypothetical protein
VATELRDTGLTVVSMGDFGTREYSDTVRKALRRSDAVVTVFSGASEARGLPASVIFEIEAAVAAGKPIFLITGLATFKLPFAAPRLGILPLNRINEIVSILGQTS